LNQHYIFHPFNGVDENFHGFFFYAETEFGWAPGTREACESGGVGLENFLIFQTRVVLGFSQ
jgi:hypothetical protein